MWRILSIAPLLALMACGSKGGGEDGTDVGEEPAAEVVEDGSDVPVEGCSADGDCDDGDPCTTDSCNDFGECLHDALDADDDGYTALTAPDGTACGGTDCDDTDEGINPGMTPGCSDAVDLDCNEIMDLDNDDDGYDAGPGSERDCGGDDCDDEDPEVNPGAEPDCSTDIDNDCNGFFDIDNDGDGFDAGEDGGRHCGGLDCDDSLATANPDADEVCLDGIDNDCEGTVDGLVPMMTALDVSYSEASAVNGTLAWSGSQYGAVYSGPIGTTEPTDGQVRSYSLSEEGSLLSRTDNRLTPTSRPHHNPGVVWTGTRYVVGYEKRLTTGGDADVTMAVFSSSWAPDGSEVTVFSSSNPGESPALVWTGSRVGMCWAEIATVGPVKCTSMLATGGDRWGTNAEFSTSGRRSTEPDIAWSGSEFGVVWEAIVGTSGVYNEVYFQRLGADGTVLGSPLALDSGFTGHHSTPRVAWAGSRWAAVWSETIDLAAIDAHLLLIEPGGTAAGSSTVVSPVAGTSGLPDVLWTGSEIVVAWTDLRTGMGSLQIYLRSFDTSGVARSDEVQATASVHPSSDPHLVMAASEIGMVWREEESVTAPKVYFNRFGFCR